ncbi:tripartite tricarboxylate transporter substrate binding protein [Sediminicoccus sp. KRV36]|uniref:Bug family tripartite tricarboxylate transporter substrate binding protein n=1 Tax=Sediminicoccus sp. KRV36 TaxID=3133721 RepID=UPI00200F09C2|nr:tripartite tricarboxylate transporter substrate binding protein [Sediminicoccus rosea]UPY37416.1 tripartite tricarboxylate transporter substrate binding protein [Sediminicoccus rosea]
MPTLTRRAALLGVPALAAPAFSPRASAQAAWPDRPIRWIVNFPPGGAADTLSRILAPVVSARLGQPVVVENRPGAGGALGADILAKAPGDRFVVMMSSAASHGIGPVLYRNPPYDALRDFSHIRLVGTFPSVLAVNLDFPARNLAEYLAVARQRPVTYGSGGNGTLNHLVGQVLARAAGVELTHVPYRGSAPALTDTIGGQIPSIMESLPIALPHLRGGRLRALATSEATRPASLPDVPTFAEQGFPQVTSSNWFGFSAPAGLPPDIIARWDAEIAQALADPAVVERFGTIGVRPGAEGPAGYTALITGELDRWRAVIAAGNITPD